MKYTSIKSYLKSYAIYGHRSTSISHGFASAIAPIETYDESRIKQALASLGQDPNNLTCVFCGKEAETWDHLVNLVLDGQLHGYGHQLGNLLPCCRRCNSKKGGRNWREYLHETAPNEAEYERKSGAIQIYLDTYARPVNTEEMKIVCPEDWKRFCEIKQQIFSLMREADEIAPRLREAALLQRSQIVELKG
jgi:hypothetical protein